MLARLSRSLTVVILLVGCASGGAVELRSSGGSSDPRDGEGVERSGGDEVEGPGDVGGGQGERSMSLDDCVVTSHGCSGYYCARVRDLLHHLQPEVLAPCTRATDERPSCERVGGGCVSHYPPGSEPDPEAQPAPVAGDCVVGHFCCAQSRCVRSADAAPADHPCVVQCFVPPRAGVARCEQVGERCQTHWETGS